MIKIKFSTQFSDLHLIRQTPNSSGIWGDCQFFIDQDVEECDFWVVYDEPSRTEKTKCSPENIILITAEPPSVKSYNKNFIKQFGLIITCNRNIKHPNIIYTQQGLPWNVGLRRNEKWSTVETKTYDDFKTTKYIEKNKLMSTVVSNKSFTEGHRKRLTFLKAVYDYFGSQVDILGIETTPVFGIENKVNDKWDAVSKYKYHLAIENSSYPDYWTEKLADAYLDGAYPFYYGCPNISDYFPEGSYTYIDITKPEEAIRIIEETIKNNQYEKSIDKIKEARDLVLDKYNLFALISEVCNSRISSKAKSNIIIKPQSIMANDRKFFKKIVSGISCLVSERRKEIYPNQYIKGG
ncbi:MAG: hypothetical protein A2287_06120 [Candidatus Melainabacteria bacterium RIFOXYA12_FULL_32_12]|nr:MAG: hypothetical protein A2255_00720 [Candidatus Melainabacteria bacterium RIFOXYA2_FULL_32_9]OGI27555.1 MAG: hypothetical protein A2287_06120 [Candidatus Melainabacteria bacterium RIFOXYA12_FULL_32_12]